jgi:hypothetical protein
VLLNHVHEDDRAWKSRTDELSVGLLVDVGGREDTLDGALVLPCPRVLGVMDSSTAGKFVALMAISDSFTSPAPPVAMAETIAALNLPESKVEAV